MSAQLLTLIATPELEERLVDWLLDAGHDGFTTLVCRGHGVQPQQLSTAEQVAGRQQRVAFWLQLSEPDARRVLGGLAREFGATGLHYWITPVLSAGPLTPEQVGGDPGPEVG